MTDFTDWLMGTQRGRALGSAARHPHLRDRAIRYRQVARAGILDPAGYCRRARGWV